MGFRNYSIGSRLILGFGVVLLLVVLLGGIAFQQTNKLWKNTADMYEHPLQVSRATRDIKANIITIQWLMKDVVLDEKLTRNDVVAITHQIDDYEARVYKSFDIVYDRYLGDKKDIDQAFNSFRNWNPKRDILIDLKQKGDAKGMYDRFKTVNVPYMVTMLKNVQTLIDYANNKADTLYLSAQNDKDMLFTRLWIVMIAIFILTFVVGLLLIRGIRSPLIALTKVAEKFRKKHYEVRSDYVSTNEIGTLAATFNHLGARVEQEIMVKENAAWISGILLKENDLGPFSKVLLGLLLTKTGAQVAAIYYLSDDETQFEHFESIGMAKENCKSFSAQTNEGEFGAVISNKKIVRISKIPEDTIFTLPVVTGIFRPREIITIPILDGNKIVSIISLACLNDFGSIAIQLINEIWLPLNARINGVLVFQKIQEISERLREQNCELEAQSDEMTMQANELKEYTTELELQKRHLDEANQLKSSFLSNMSHELRTPLNSVIALSGVLNRRLNEKIPEEEFKYLGIIERNGKQLLELINDILDLSRIESGKEEFTYTGFSVYNLVHDLTSSLEPIGRDKGIFVKNYVDPQLPSIVSDQSKCNHILQNIIGNAVKFTNVGGVDISAKIENDKVVIAVRDTGIGISAENLPYIFDEFRQADGMASRIYGGTGLGLAIAHKYTVLLDGNISVESQLGAGSIFTVTWPIVPAFEKKNGKEHNHHAHLINDLKETNFEPKLLKGKNLLLIEDNEAQIIQLKEILREDHYNIQVANNGKEALEIIQTFIPDAIVLDLMMPEVDGFAVLGAIREVKETSKIPVLILSAKHITKEELSFLKGNSIYQLIQKGDVNRDDLLSHIRNMMGLQKKETTISIHLNPNPDIASGRKSILVIEDNKDNMATVKALLGNRHAIIEAYDGFEGLDKAKTLLPHLILLDISLPGIDGLEVLTEIKKDKRMGHIPVIALTARAMNGDREELLAYGFNDYISKPIDSSMLEIIINKWLNGN